jgi:hypothetical protein
LKTLSKDKNKLMKSIEAHGNDIIIVAATTAMSILEMHITTPLMKLMNKNNFPFHYESQFVYTDNITTFLDHCNGNTPLPQSFLNSSDCRTGFSAGPTEALYVAVLLSAIFGLFVCNGFAKHVPWFLISCLTYFICNLGSKYNGRICPGFINSKSGKQSYPQSFCKHYR